MSDTAWPSTPEDLIVLQRGLAAHQTGVIALGDDSSIGGCFVCFGRGHAGRGQSGDRGWAAAASFAGDRLVSSSVITGFATGSYQPGLLALREGPLLSEAVRSLDRQPDAVLVNATGRDHPRRAGLALHLGAVLAVPSVGVTHRPLLATGSWPDEQRGAHSPLYINGEQVGHWLRTRQGARPLAVSPGWGIDLDRSVEVVLGAVHQARTPEPIREARRLARQARSAATDTGV